MQMVGGVQEELTIGAQERPISEVVTEQETTSQTAGDRKPRRRSPRRKTKQGVTVLPLWDD
ncbi:hypothetical protein [Streptomyces sp. NPDC127197]|uniref:hypothetical protein n=1 Tax=Streptomyces sp. NPDC127197 TaxID=3345388 RepID=UPI003638D6B3